MDPYWAEVAGTAFFAANEATMAAMPITIAKIPAISARRTTEIRGKMRVTTSSRSPKMKLTIPRMAFPASFCENAW